MSEEKKKPKSNFGKCVGEEVVVFLAEADQLKALQLPTENETVTGRLVGVDKPGVWIEPKAWFDASIKAGDPVRHVFFKWDNVLGLTRSIKAEEFNDKKEYRGLRPRH